MKYREHVVNQDISIKEAIEKLNGLSKVMTLFLVDREGRLKGTLTDGDVRRALLKGIQLEQPVELAYNRNFSFVKLGAPRAEDFVAFRKSMIKLIPVLDEQGCISEIVNIDETKTILPIDVVVMAGGKGERLRPLTLDTPKPMLPLGNKPIIEHNIDRLVSFGVENIQVSVRYLAHKITEYLGDGASKDIQISYIKEDEPLGTIGSIRLAGAFKNDYILVINSDILTNVDYEDLFLFFTANNADFAIVTVPYSVNVPFAVLETAGDHVIALKEKPTFHFKSNAGIYLMKKDMLSLIPADGHYNATDLIEKAIDLGHTVVTYNHSGYWLDIGRHEE
ncbi:MAG TPA: nucleotidyltransferase family protein, partial [Luteibaculaceae bacterium]|nr:nucleotidyltransferase family protein [Luteibaculaceae bacterium]